MYEGGKETYSAEADRDVSSMVDNEHLKYTATIPLYTKQLYILGKCRLTEKLFKALATLILKNSNFWVSML